MAHGDTIGKELHAVRSALARELGALNEHESALAAATHPDTRRLFTKLRDDARGAIAECLRTLRALDPALDRLTTEDAPDRTQSGSARSVTTPSLTVGSLKRR